MRVLLPALLAMLGAFGCTSVSSSAVRTDGLPPRAHMGGVRVYAVVPPQQVKVVGVVEVHAVNEEATLPTLMPVLLRRVAELGGTGVIIDRVDTTYDLRTEIRTETYAYPCGFRGTCWGTRLTPYTVTIRTLSIQGRAIVPIETSEASDAGGASPSGTP